MYIRTIKCNVFGCVSSSTPVKTIGVNFVEYIAYFIRNNFKIKVNILFDIYQKCVKCLYLHEP